LNNLETSPIQPLHYRVNLFDAARHLLLVTLTVEAKLNRALPLNLELSLPAWIPGSYLVRDFARHITQIGAQNETNRKTSALKLEKRDKHSWQLRLPEKTTKISVNMLVYAWDLSVRGAHFDSTHCFFNGSSIFLRVAGFENGPHSVSLHATNPQHGKWKVATAMPPLITKGAITKQPITISQASTATFQTASYDELIDHPFELGMFTYASFKAQGVVHHVAVTGKANFDSDRLCQDLKTICDAQIAFFEPHSKKAPFNQYWFMITAVGEGYGGLEHRASTALICTRYDLPFVGMPSLIEPNVHEGYKTLLGLASHEYFHTWNVKRIKPAAFAPYDLNQENYTKLLWIFEGFTSYYDDLFLARTGLISQETYFKTLADTLSGVQKTPGRLRQSVAESSFDAWTKYYKQDENAVNSMISYYTKGSLVALALDLTIRAQTGAARVSPKAKSLDDVMRALWTAFKNGEFLGEEQFVDVVEKATGVDVFVEVQRWAYGTEDIALAPLLAEMGLSLEWRYGGKDAVWLGGKLSAVTPAGITIQNAVGHGPLAKAGLSAGDVIIAINGIKADERCLTGLLQRTTPGENISLQAFRRDELLSFNLRAEAPPLQDASITSSPKPTAIQKRQLLSWLT
jgi:predicted metalloprotease with PDZ domain